MRGAFVAAVLAIPALACVKTTTLPDNVFAGSNQGQQELGQCSNLSGDAGTICRRDAAERLVQWNRLVSACYGYAWQYPYSGDELLRRHLNTKRWMRMGDQDPLRQHKHLVGDGRACLEAAQTALDPTDRDRLHARACGMGLPAGCACLEASGSTITVDDQRVSCAGGAPLAAGSRLSSAEIEAELYQERPADHGKCTGAYCRCHDERTVGACADAARASADAVGAFTMLRLGCPASKLGLVAACYQGKLTQYADHLGVRLQDVLDLALCARGEADDPSACGAKWEAYERSLAENEAHLTSAMQTLRVAAAETDARRARAQANRQRFEAESRRRRNEAISQGFSRVASDLEAGGSNGGRTRSGGGSSGGDTATVMLTAEKRDWPGPGEVKPRLQRETCPPDKWPCHYGCCDRAALRQKFEAVKLCAGQPGCSSQPAGPSRAVQQ